jgi:glutathione peroxidase
MGLYDVRVTSIDGVEHAMAAYRGQALLVVNVASECGFTPQYEGLEALHRRYAARGFAVLGFPCNQFGGQEPGSEAEIRQFCSRRYDVTFPLFVKVDVNGAHTHPLFDILKREAPGVAGSTSIKWNFTKFLIAPDGRVVRRYGSSTAPEAIAGDIEAALPPDRRV